MLRSAFALAILATLAACSRSSPAPVVYGSPPITLPSASAGQRVVAADGDTVFALARKYDVPVRDLIEVNGLAPPYRLQTGRALLIPAAQTHLVQPGETIYSLSRRYGVDMREVARANHVAPPYGLRVGERLRVPRGAAPEPVATVVVARPEPPAPAVKPAPPGAVGVTELPPPAAMAPAPILPPAPAVPPANETAAVAPPPAAIPERAGRAFLWPVTGKVVSRFGSKPGGLQNDGINIAAPKGAPVRAAENGVVVYAGNELRGFGNLLLVRHSDGWVSAYAHNEQLLVDRGAPVKRGQVIAKVGSTGSVTAPQLHFELRQGVNAVDPLRYLGKPEGPAVSATGGPGDRPGPG